MYTYEIDPTLFFDYLIKFLQEKEKTTEEKIILDLIKDSKCFIEHSIPDHPGEPPAKPLRPLTVGNSFGFHSSISNMVSNIEQNSYQTKIISYQREKNIFLSKRNIYEKYLEKSIKLGAIIYFSIPNDPKIYKKTKEKLKDICNHVMPANVGFNINRIEIKPFVPEMNGISPKNEFKDIIKYIDSGEFKIPSEKKYLNIKDIPDGFYEELVFLINKCYFLGIYESVQIFSRKLLENLLIDILRKKFNTKKIDLFYNVNSRRFNGFSTLLDNFKENLDEFKPYSGALNHDFLNKIRKFKVYGDSSAHTLELNIRKEELDKEDLEYIIKQLIRIYNNIESN